MAVCRRPCLAARLILILSGLLAASGLFSQETRSENSIRRVYSSEERQRKFAQVLAVFSSATVPPAYRERLVDTPLPTCATFLMTEMRHNLQNFDPQEQSILRPLLLRPTLPLNHVSPSGNFRIHYSGVEPHAVPAADIDSNGLPDFVEEVARAFDESYDLEVTMLGYRAAPGDGGVDGLEYDIYMQALGPQSYGFTQGEVAIPGTPQNDYTSYIVIDNDFENDHFTTGVDGARVTVAHEYFHAIQFGYRLFANSEEPFYYEMCSTWMEDIAYDDIDDYFQYLPVYFGRTDIPFNHFDRFLHAYGQAVWNHFVVKNFADIDVIRRSWEVMQTGPLALAAIDQSLIAKGSRFEDAFAEFAVWNFYTGNRADPLQFYEESPEYPQIKLNGDFVVSSDTSIIDSSLSLTTKYFRLTTATSGDYSITGMVDDIAAWNFWAIVRAPGRIDSTYNFNIANGQSLGFLPSRTEIVVMPTNLQILDGPDLPQLNSRYSRFRFNLIEGAIDDGGVRGITAAYPNPFVVGQHSGLTFTFLSANTEDLQVRILTSEGRVIRTVKFSDGSNALAQTFFTWDGLDDDRVVVASGIYLFQLQQDDFVDIKKIAVIHQ
ncbi:MAG TPA: MXAN_6640 family putative metalloprotease [bacterium]